MRRLILSLSALSLAIPASFTLPTSPAEARKAQTYRGKSQRYYRDCRYSSGTTGLIAGGVGGAVIGDKVIGGGVLGPVVGAVGGALAGRAIDRSITAKKRCR
jgi:outer membrane lipoprotein SlyB